MIFVRGIRGNIKLNPAITLWGGLGLAIALLAGGTIHQIRSFQTKVTRCQERGDIWVGYAGFGRLVPTGECIIDKRRKPKGDRK